LGRRKSYLSIIFVKSKDLTDMENFETSVCPSQAGAWEGGKKQRPDSHEKGELGKEIETKYLTITEDNKIFRRKEKSCSKEQLL